MESICQKKKYGFIKKCPKAMKDVSTLRNIFKTQHNSKYIIRKELKWLKNIYMGQGKYTKRTILKKDFIKSIFDLKGH